MLSSIIHISAPAMSVHNIHLDFSCCETSLTTSSGEETFDGCPEHTEKRVHPEVQSSAEPENVSYHWEHIS